jgi:hypothetical protein
MEQTDAGDLVKVAVGSREIDASSLTPPVASKVVVAMVDRRSRYRLGPRTWQD